MEEIQDIDTIEQLDKQTIESTKSIQLTGLDNTDEDAELDNILLNQLTLAKEKTQQTSNSKYNDAKVTDLRSIIKDNMDTLTSKGVKIQNLSKLKRTECIEILSKS